MHTVHTISLGGLVAATLAVAAPAAMAQGATQVADCAAFAAEHGVPLDDIC